MEKMQEAVRSSRQTIAVLSEDYLNAEYTHSEWQAAFVKDPRGIQRKLLPIRVAPCSPPGLLEQRVWIELVGKSEEEAEVLLLEALKERGKPEVKPSFPGSETSERVHSSQPRIPHPSKLRYSSRLPKTSQHLLGREEQLALLDDAWQDPQTHVLTVVAPGGIGKTALVNHWLAQMATEGYRGAQRVFARSFYSQGAGESKNATGEPFLQEALAWFGDPNPQEGSPWQRAERLADPWSASSERC